MIDLNSGIVLLVCGILAGFLGGFFGVGGGILIVPVLVLVLEGSGVSSLVSTHLAFGTSLCVAAIASFSPAYQAVRNGHITRKSALLAGIAGVLAAVVGSFIAGGLEGTTLRLLLGITVLIPALQFLAGGATPKRGDERPITRPALFGSGLVTGFVSSLTGVEGSVAGLPLMYRLMSFPLKEAAAISHAATLSAALASSVMYVVTGWGNTLLPAQTLGYVGYLAAVPLIAGTLPVAAWGATFARKTRPGKNRKYYGAFLLAIAVKMMFF